MYSTDSGWQVVGGFEDVEASGFFQGGDHRGTVVSVEDGPDAIRLKVGLCWRFTTQGHGLRLESLASAGVGDDLGKGFPEQAQQALIIPGSQLWASIPDCWKDELLRLFIRCAQRDPRIDQPAEVIHGLRCEVVLIANLIDPCRARGVEEPTPQLLVVLPQQVSQTALLHRSQLSHGVRRALSQAMKDARRAGEARVAREGVLTDLGGGGQRCRRLPVQGRPFGAWGQQGFKRDILPRGEAAALRIVCDQLVPVHFVAAGAIGESAVGADEVSGRIVHGRRGRGCGTNRYAAIQDGLRHAGNAHRAPACNEPACDTPTLLFRCRLQRLGGRDCREVASQMVRMKRFQLRPAQAQQGQDAGGLLRLGGNPPEGRERISVGPVDGAEGNLQAGGRVPEQGFT
ncbi:hypothetical protein PALA50_06150 (plasmid) [Pseudomonas aeruginosa]|nr:hypothetical protein PALA50_06150 [Pseudomonas aeruginosa]